MTRTPCSVQVLSGPRVDINKITNATKLSLLNWEDVGGWSEACPRAPKTRLRREEQPGPRMLLIWSLWWAFLTSKRIIIIMMTKPTADTCWAPLCSKSHLRTYRASQSIIRPCSLVLESSLWLQRALILITLGLSTLGKSHGLYLAFCNRFSLELGVSSAWHSQALSAGVGGGAG